MPLLQHLLGPESDWWEDVRSSTLPGLDRVLSRVGMYAAYQLAPREYAGHVSGDVEDAEQMLWDAGLRRNPVAALKTLADGRGEKGSWVYRDSPFSRKQVHVMLFEANGGGVDMYAHEEYSSINPFVMRRHYLGVGYSPAEGKKRLVELLK